ncbi:MAG: hypothetical protein U7126_12810 [Microcoleus sp.]
MEQAGEPVKQEWCRLWNRPDSLLSKNGARYEFEYRASSDRATVFGNAAGDILMILALRAIDPK